MSESTEGPAEQVGRAGYHRDRVTWAVFAALLTFGILNAVLGPALPYLRAVERIGYVVGALHQVAFALGGGLAGVIATRAGDRPSRTVIISVGLLGAAAAAVGVGYGNAAVVTVVAAFFLSLLGTSALVRLWAALADAHSQRRAVAMSEGEIAVSLGGILAPLLVGGLAATALNWRFAFIVGAVLVALAVVLLGATRVPEAPRSAASARGGPPLEPVPVDSGRQRRRTPMPTLGVVFAVVAFEWALSFWLASYLHDSVGLHQRLAVLMVAGLYVANLAGRLAASRLAGHIHTGGLLAGSLAVALAGSPVLLAAAGPVVAALGLVIVGAGIGAAFPLASALHIGASTRRADPALGQVFTTAAAGQIAGPLATGAIAQAAGLRLGLLVLPALALAATGALACHRINHRTAQ
jgi:MFS family permease